ncbi:ISL3 family transposase [Candidatus Spongiisocius sp.]|uniref:ISL3 family transposase n=1 Tax=Candidatus Spongiisocius sp. TaxID=3101273 RepID=UPI003B5C0C71
MGLVRAESARVAKRRRARRCRVLLVDETSIRRRHRYVTVVACGDTKQVLAMIPGRTKASLARFFREQGPGWCRGVEIVVTDGSRSYQAAIAQYLPTARHVLDRFHVVRVRHEALCLRVRVRDPCRWSVTAVR